MGQEKIQTPSGTKGVMRGNLLVLREYARRVIVERDDTLISLQNLMRDLMREYFTQGEALKLTERDLAVLLYKGILD